MQSSSNRNSAESKAIANITEFDQSTHNATVSVGTITGLRQLQDIYIGKDLDEKEIDEKYEILFENAFKISYDKLKETLQKGKDDQKKLLIDKLLKTDIIKQFKQILDDVSEDKINTVLTFMFNKVSEDVNKYDYVDILVPDPEDPSKLKVKKELFTLWKTTMLIWIAIQDGAMFETKSRSNSISSNTSMRNANSDMSEDKSESENSESENNSSSSDEENLKPDIYYRNLTFLNSLDRSKDQGICHHGYRNDLFNSCINFLFKNINVLLDPVTPALAYLKENISKKFWESYNNLPTDIDRRELGEALLTWMAHSNPQKIVQLIDRENTIREGLKEIYRANGNIPEYLVCRYNDKNLSLDALIDLLETQLHFTPDAKHENLVTLHEILSTAPELKKDSVRDETLVRINDWIWKEIPLDSKNINLEHFVQINKAYETLTKNPLFLTLISFKNSRDVAALTLLCNNYFNAFQIDNDASTFETDYKTIIDFNNEYKILIQNSYVDKIQEYFPLLSLKETQADMYMLLIQDAFTDKVFFTDTAIQQILEATKAASADSSTLGIYESVFGPYETNRSILHALTNENWSPLFLQLIIGVRDLVKAKKQELIRKRGSRRAQIENNQNVSTAINFDYVKAIDDRIMAQLDYLIAKHQNPNADIPIPEKMLLLPKAIKTYDALKQLYDFVGPDSIEIIYNNNSLDFFRLLHSKILSLGNQYKATNNSNVDYRELTNDVIDILNIAPENKLNSLLTTLLKKVDFKLLNIPLILNKVDTDKEKIIFEIFFKNAPNFINNTSTLIHVLNNVTIEKESFDLVLNKLGSDLVNIIKTIGFTQFLDTFRGESYSSVGKIRIRMFFKSLSAQQFLQLYQDEPESSYYRKLPKHLNTAIIAYHQLNSSSGHILRNLNNVLRRLLKKDSQAFFNANKSQIKEWFFSLDIETQLVDKFCEVTDSLRIETVRALMACVDFDDVRCKKLLLDNKTFGYVYLHIFSDKGVNEKVNLLMDLSAQTILQHRHYITNRWGSPTLTRKKGFINFFNEFEKSIQLLSFYDVTTDKFKPFQDIESLKIVLANIGPQKLKWLLSLPQKWSNYRHTSQSSAEVIEFLRGYIFNELFIDLNDYLENSPIKEILGEISAENIVTLLRSGRSLNLLLQDRMSASYLISILSKLDPNKIIEMLVNTSNVDRIQIFAKFYELKDKFVDANQSALYLLLDNGTIQNTIIADDDLKNFLAAKRSENNFSDMFNCLMTAELVETFFDSAKDIIDYFQYVPVKTAIHLIHTWQTNPALFTKYFDKGRSDFYTFISRLPEIVSTLIVMNLDSENMQDNNNHNSIIESNLFTGMKRTNSNASDDNARLKKKTKDDDVEMNVNQEHSSYVNFSFFSQNLHNHHHSNNNNNSNNDYDNIDDNVNDYGSRSPQLFLSDITNNNNNSNNNTDNNNNDLEDFDINKYFNF